MSNSSDITSSESVEREVKRRAAQLKQSKEFNPRREKEMNDIYDQYIPPHSIEETSHLLDVAERDAYIDPFPPIGSQKRAGKVIKKSVRVAIGWYIQYIAQQISTFGSGVAQALRSIHKDVEDLKKTVGAADLSHLLEGLDLETIDEDLWKDFSGHLSTLDGRVLISDAVDVKALSSLNAHVIIVDPRSRICSQLPATLDSRCKSFLSVIKDTEDQSLSGLVLHGQIDFLNSAGRCELVTECARVLCDDAPLILAVRTEIHGDDATVARELTGANLWSEKTWSHVLSRSFDYSEAIVANKNGICVFVNKNKAHTL